MLFFPVYIESDPRPIVASPLRPVVFSPRRYNVQMRSMHPECIYGTCQRSYDPHSATPLSATLMNLPASVANKRLTLRLSPLDATLTKNIGVTSFQTKAFLCSGPTPESFRRAFRIPSATPGLSDPPFGSRTNLRDAGPLALLHSIASRVFHNSLTIKAIHTLSLKCRVSPLLCQSHRP
jgi:hypothetical protein